MIDNPFAILERRMNRLESLLEEIKEYQLAAFASVNPSDETENGDFKWLLSFLGVPESTLRQKIAARQIPGVSKVGKRLIVNKATVRKFLRDQELQTPDKLAAEAENSFLKRHK